MRLRSRGPQGFGSGVRYDGPLDLRAPEDRFGTDDQVDARFRRPIEVPKIDEAIDEFFWNWQHGDDAGARKQAADILSLTGAHFQQQGVPVFARPILPPQLAGHVADALRRLPKPHQAKEFERLVEAFEPGVRRGVSQEVAQLMPSLPGTGARSGSGGSVQGIPHAPTWKPQPRFSLFGERPRVPANAGPNERSWDREFQERTQEGGRIRDDYENREAWTSLGGVFRTPREKLTLDERAKQQAKGNPPIFLSGKAPHPDDPYKDRVSWPVQPEDGKTEVEIISPYDLRERNGRVEFHPGVDLRNREPNGPVFSPRNGTILRIEENSAEGGNQIFILNDDGSIVGFSHTGALKGLQEGDEVYTGQQIGVSDGSGTWDSTAQTPAPHTHISYYPPGSPVDPVTKKPLSAPNARDPNAPARLQSDPLSGLELMRDARRLNPEGYTGRTPVRFLPRKRIPWPPN